MRGAHEDDDDDRTLLAKEEEEEGRHSKTLLKLLPLLTSHSTVRGPPQTAAKMG